jgi:hypothetical protein
MICPFQVLSEIQKSTPSLFFGRPALLRDNSNAVFALGIESTLHDKKVSNEDLMKILSQGILSTLNDVRTTTARGLVSSRGNGSSEMERWSLPQFVARRVSMLYTLFDCADNDSGTLTETLSALSSLKTAPGSEAFADKVVALLEGKPDQHLRSAALRFLNTEPGLPSSMLDRLTPLRALGQTGDDRDFAFLDEALLFAPLVRCSHTVSWTSICRCGEQSRIEWQSIAAVTKRRLESVPELIARLADKGQLVFLALFVG